MGENEAWSKYLFCRATIRGKLHLVGTFKSSLYADNEDDERDYLRSWALCGKQADWLQTTDVLFGNLCKACYKRLSQLHGPKYSAWLYIQNVAENDEEEIKDELD